MKRAEDDRWPFFLQEGVERFEPLSQDIGAGGDLLSGECFPSGEFDGERGIEIGDVVEEAVLPRSSCDEEERFLCRSDGQDGEEGFRGVPEPFDEKGAVFGKRLLKLLERGTLQNPL